ncbi:sporulation protein [Sutcliffiella horikoshii]|uniref:sporulation protein n=1 Tax=Sutcliffiella horikoshii TaxID=79883 RepID=UPI00384EF045
MSLFSKLITSVGIGSAKVDTKLKKNYFMQGEVLDGMVEILGGNSNQKIDAIHLKLMTLYGHEGSSRLTNTVLHTHKLNDSFTIHAGERKEIPFSFRIPLDTPITMQDPETGKNIPPVWIATEADVKNAIDPRDKDYITIEPTKVHEQILDALRVLGLKFRQMESQKLPFNLKSEKVFGQQYEFVPTFGKYFKRLEEIEVYIFQGDEETTVLFDVDKLRKTPFSSVVDKLNLDKNKGSVTFKNEQILNDRRSVSDEFEKIIDRVL